MEIRKHIAPVLIFPSVLRQKLFNELWQKDQIQVALRDLDEALVVRTRPLPSLEILFKVTNNLPVALQVFGASAEIWLGKPVVQFHSFVSESLRPGETREAFRIYTFLNPFQNELLNPPKKDSLPPNVSLNLTVSCRSSLGTVEKTTKITWKPPKIIV